MSSASSATGYSLARCADDTGYGEDELSRWVEAIHRKGQAIVSGPTGAGKTFLAQHLAQHLAGGDGVVDHLQFHSSYRYEDFIERHEGEARTPGRLMEFLARARDRAATSVLVIDEIHRADVASVMGEALHALEHRARPVRLARGAELTIPRNVVVLATACSDRAGAMTDPWLRRRFASIALPARYDVLARFLTARGFDAVGLLATLRSINAALGEPSAAIGPAAFFRDDLAAALEDVWIDDVEPHLDHHLKGDLAALEPFRWERVRTVVLGER